MKIIKLELSIYPNNINSIHFCLPSKHDVGYFYITISKYNYVALIQKSKNTLKMNLKTKRIIEQAKLYNIPTKFMIIKKHKNEIENYLQDTSSKSSRSLKILQTKNINAAYFLKYKIIQEKLVFH